MTKVRQVIEVEGLSHGAPIPLGTRIGNIVYSSGISGKDPVTGIVPEDPDKQAEQLFKNIRMFMKNAGATTDHIIRMTVFLKDDKLRESINKEWLKMFPDEHDRPARHALAFDLRGKVHFQIELVAVIQ